MKQKITVIHDLLQIIFKINLFKLIKKYPNKIQYIKNPSDALQQLAVKKIGVLFITFKIQVKLYKN